MKYAIIYALFVVSIYFIESRYHHSLNTEVQVMGDCQYKLYPMSREEDNAQRCIFCVPSTDNRIAFRLDTAFNKLPETYIKELQIEELYQYECRKHRCREIANATTYGDFPQIGQTVQAQIFMYNYSFAGLDTAMTTRKCTKGKCSTIKQVDLEGGSKAYNYAFLAKFDNYHIADAISASYHTRNHQRYYYDLFLQLISVFMLILFMKSLGEVRSNDLVGYMQGKQTQIVLAILAMIQPFRIFTSVRFLSNLDGLFGALPYSLGKLYLFQTFLQMIDVSRGINNKKIEVTHNPYNFQIIYQGFIILIGLPLVIERVYVQHFDSTTILLDTLVELSHIENLLNISIIALNFYGAVFIYKAFLQHPSAQGQYQLTVLWVVVIAFMAIYSQHLLFYLQRQNVSDHVFNSFEQLIVVGLFNTLIHVTDDRQRGSNPQEFELPRTTAREKDSNLFSDDQEALNVQSHDSKYDQLEEEDSDSHNRVQLDQEIADYYTKPEQVEEKPVEEDVVLL